MSDWPHAPPHIVRDAGIYMVTGATYLKAHYFRNIELCTSECREAWFGSGCVALPLVFRIQLSSVGCEVLEDL